MRNFLLQCLLCLLAGFIYSLGFPSKLIPYFPLTAILGFAFLLCSLSKEKQLKKQALLLCCFFFGIYIIGLSWLAFTLKEFAFVPSPYNYGVGILCSLLFFPHYWLYLLLRKFALKSRHLSPASSLGAPLHAMGLVLLDFFIPQQFPNSIGHTWMALPSLLGLAPLFGSALYSFISYWAALVLGEFFCRRKILPSSLFLFLGAMALFTVGNRIFPLPRQNHTSPSTPRIHLRIVQSNIANSLKLSAEQGDLKASKIVAQTYYKLSTQSPREGSPPLDLIIWPETAMEFPLESTLIQGGMKNLPSLFSTIIEKTGAELVTGGYDLVSGATTLYFEDEYNTLFHINKKYHLKEVYHKQILTPFGETMPFGPLNRWIFHHFEHASFFAKGKRKPLFTLEGGGRFIPAICYEILFPHFINNYINSLEARPHFIVNLTNDSWYGNTSEPLQHLLLSHWRAIELGIPVIRSTNTGITSVLYPDGTSSQSLKVNTQGNLDVVLPLQETSPTPFQRYGILPCLLFMLFFNGAGLILVFILKKQKPKVS